MVEGKMLRQVEEKFQSMNLTLQKSQKMYEDSKENRQRESQAHFNSIRESIEIEKKKRFLKYWEKLEK